MELLPLMTAMQNSKEYADEELYPDEKLLELNIYWLSQLDNPERSPRAKKDIERLIGYQAFEISQRLGVDSVISFDF